MINLLKMGFITTVNISCVQRNRKDKGGTNRREGGREGGRKGGRKGKREREKGERRKRFGIEREKEEGSASC